MLKEMLDRIKATLDNSLALHGYTGKEQAAISMLFHDYYVLSKRMKDQIYLTEHGDEIFRDAARTIEVLAPNPAALYNKPVLVQGASLRSVKEDKYGL
jgi:hypothetical protein